MKPEVWVRFAASTRQASAAFGRVAEAMRAWLEQAQKISRRDDPFASRRVATIRRRPRP